MNFRNEKCEREINSVTDNDQQPCSDITVFRALKRGLITLIGKGGRKKQNVIIKAHISQILDVV